MHFTTLMDFIGGMMDLNTCRLLFLHECNKSDRIIAFKGV